MSDSAVAAAISIVRRAWFDGLCPPEEISVTEWADKYRVLPAEGSVEPGRYRSDRTPYVREILDALHPNSGVRRVVWQKGAQIGASEAGNNWLGFLIDQFPGPIMVVQPSDERAEDYSTTRLGPTFRDTPRLAAIMPAAKSRDSQNTKLRKIFRGGLLLVRGAESPSGLRSQAIRYLMLDEVDAYPADCGGEGDPVKLAETRIRTAGTAGKVFMLSTPLLKGNSRIEVAFLRGDQRYYFVPCPECDEFQRLVWDNLKWDKDKPDSAKYACEHCGVLIDERHKSDMLARGEWRATAEPIDTTTRSYHLNSLYSPPGWYSWADAARDFLEAKASGSPFMLQQWINTVLGETWAGSGDAPEAEMLYERSRQAKYSSGEIPADVLMLTIGADVQKDRVECEVVGWGPNYQRYSIEYHIFPGEHVGTEVWKELDKLLLKSWEHPGGGLLQVAKLAVDAAFDQSAVAKWVRRQSAGRVMAIHGSDRVPIILGQPRRADARRDGRTLKRGFVLWPVGSSVAKTELYARLRIKASIGDAPAPSGFCHFPRDYGLTYFEQLTAEQLVFERSRTGTMRPVWVKKGRNEALDCAVYARAAAYSVGIDRYRDEHWAALAESLGVALPQSAPQAPGSTSPTPAAQARAPARAREEQPPRGNDRSYLGKWRAGRNWISRD